MNTFTHFPIENVLQSNLTNLLWNDEYTFTHFPIENVLQSNQSSLKWWIHSLISQSKRFSRVTNLLWNDEYSSFPDRKCSPEWPIFSEMMNTLHLPVENVLQNDQSSLKWWILFISRSKMLSRVTNQPSLKWWIHSLISQSKTFSRVPFQCHFFAQCQFFFKMQMPFSKCHFYQIWHWKMPSGIAVKGWVGLQALSRFVWQRAWKANIWMTKFWHDNLQKIKRGMLLAK